MKKKLFGLILTICLSLLFVTIFFGKLLLHPNSTYFAGSGDGLKTYYGAIYHIKYDKSYMHFDGMNYPYGEVVTYTDNQPLITNAIRFISKNVVDISNYTVGIFNLLMLSSIIIAALIIFLIFFELIEPITTKDLRFTTLYSSIASVAIAFMSPQIGRLTGHFSLSYIFIIPLFLLLFIKFHKYNSLKWSIWIGLSIFMLAFIHMYYIGIFTFILFFYWLVIIISKKLTFSNIINHFKNISIQFIIPLIIIEIIFLLTDSVSDRTNNPWGFMYYRAYPESVFLPINKPYYQNLFGSWNPAYINWEGYAFVGLLGVIGFTYLLNEIIRGIFHLNSKQIFNVSQKKILNIFFWASFVSLLYSFGVPFIFKMKFLINYIGPLKQMRSIARFSWLFYYVINIIIFYKIINRAKQINNTVYKFIILILPLMFVGFDAFINCKGIQNYMNNSIPELDDKANSSPANQWLNKIDAVKYQAIIPIPYFNVGCENYWIDAKNPDCSMLKTTFIASLKTALPTTAVMMGRTSISQTLNNINLFLEPYRKLKLLVDLPQKKPFLLIVTNCNELNDNEKLIISKSAFIFKTETASYYELPVNNLISLADSLYDKSNTEFHNSKLFKFDNIYSSDAEKNYIYDGYDNKQSTIRYQGNGAYSGNIHEYNRIFEGSINNYKINTDYVFSFWFYNISTDLYPRSTMEICYADNSDKNYKVDYTDVWRNFTVIDGNWALTEVKFRFNNKDDKLKITLWNNDIRKGNLIIDELLIRPVDNNIYILNPNSITKNNRTYIRNL